LLSSCQTLLSWDFRRFVPAFIDARLTTLSAFRFANNILISSLIAFATSCSFQSLRLILVTIRNLLGLLTTLPDLVVMAPVSASSAISSTSLAEANSSS